MYKSFFYLAIIALVIISCDPQRDDDFQLGPAPGDAQMSVEFVIGDSNRVVVKDLTAESFQRLWDLPGATPKTSSKAVDTFLYTDAGEFTISLFVSSASGGGTTSTSQKITILKDAPLPCTPKLELLTGGCGANGKCWTFTNAGGAVKVGPSYGDFSWYTSPEGGLQAAQYDDQYCFTVLGSQFENRNNGQSVNPWNGYMPENLNPGVSEFLFLEGTGTAGRDQIIIPDNQFMGVWDIDNVMDVIRLTDEELVVAAPIRAQDGTPAAEGWFELSFIAL
ncbi:MAG: PKD domain-containing protein [Saprospiraceae bacterium]